MPDKQQTAAFLLQQKLLPLFYHDSMETSGEILRALYAGGLRAVEFTNRGEHALHNFSVLKKLVDEEMPGMLLGIGTIKSAKDARRFIGEGADFVVCPTVDSSVADAVAEADLLWVPGTMTPTEISMAETFGATLVKVFPGNILTPVFISSVKELFPGLSFLVTGGVEPEEQNLAAWFRSGVAAVGMGSMLIKKSYIENNDFAGLTAAAEKTLRLVQSIATAKT